MSATVLVVEDDAFARTSVASILAAEGFAVTATADSAASAMAAIRTYRPHVLLSDLLLGPGPTGLDIAIAARRLLPEIGVVILSGFAEARLLDPALPPMPSGGQYVSKADVHHPNVIVHAVNRALSRAADPSSGTSALTDTQIELLRLVAIGCSNKEIAARRSTSVKSVEAAIQRLTRRLGIVPSQTANQRIALTNAYWQGTGQHRFTRP